MTQPEKQADLAASFQPDYTPEQMENLGVYDALYRNQGPRLASLGEWKPEWISEHDPKGWAQWYKRYVAGRRIPDEDTRQIKRWLNFKSRHGGPFTKNPTPRRGWALRNWGIDPANLVPNDQRNGVVEMLDEYKTKAMQKHLAKQADLLPGISLQPHQQRIADEVTGGDNRLLVYHGLGSGKSLSALAAAEAAKKKFGDNYGVVVPAALKGNFNKEIKKFTNSHPEVMSYTALGMGKQFQTPPQTLIMDEAHRLRNPEGAAANAASTQARSARNLLLLTGSPITNEPGDLANLLSLLHNSKITPEQFNERFIEHKKVHPGIINWFRGIQPGEQPVVKNESELRRLLRGHVDYQPSKNPKGVNVAEETIKVPLSPAQQKIQKAVRTKIPPGFLWKLDSEFPLSRDELAKLNSFMTGLRQVSMSTRPFRADKDPLKAYEQSSKLQTAMQNLKAVLDSDERKKAIIYSNHIDAGLAPYAAALEKNKIPHALFHGSISPTERQKAVDEYNAGKLRALLIGPAGAEGLSTKGTSLIQLLDPHWHESRSQQARGRGLRFDSHEGLPEDLKNVDVQRYISGSENPSWFGKLLGYKRERTGDEILAHLAENKEMLNNKFRQILQEEGTQKTSAAVAVHGVRNWYKQALVAAAPMPRLSVAGRERMALPRTAQPAAKTQEQKKKRTLRLPKLVPTLGTLGLGLGALGTGTAYGIASDSHIDDLRKNLQRYDAPLGPDETNLSRYADVMSVGARSTPMGVSMPDILTQARTNKTLLSLAGVPKNYAALHPGTIADAAAHYNLFKTGPIAGYTHMLVDARLTPEQSEGGFNPAALKKLTELGLNPGNKERLGLGEGLNPRFMAAYDKWMAEQRAPGGRLEGSGGWIHPKILSTKFVPHDEQMKFLKQYIKDLPPEVRDEETRINAGSLANNSRNYIPIMRHSVGIRDRLKHFGMTAGGASAGALLAHTLHKLMTRRGEDADDKDKQPRAKKFDPVYLASILAGTGLGGLAGHYAGRPSGPTPA